MTVKDDVRSLIKGTVQNPDCIGKLIILPLDFARDMELKPRLDITVIVYENYSGYEARLFKMPHASSPDQNMSQIGTWNTDQGLTMTNKNLQGMLVDLTGTTIKVATLPAPPVITRFNQTSAEGFAGDMISLMAETHGFELRFFPSFDGKYGSDVNGSWDGFVQMLIERQVDLVGAYFGMTQERSKGNLISLNNR